MDDVALAHPIDGAVIDTSLYPRVPTERADHVAANLDDPALRRVEEAQQQVVDEAIHSLTGKGKLIDRII